MEKKVCLNCGETKEAIKKHKLICGETDIYSRELISEFPRHRFKLYSKKELKKIQLMNDDLMISNY